MKPMVKVNVLTVFLLWKLPGQFSSFENYQNVKYRAHACSRTDFILSFCSYTHLSKKCYFSKHVLNVSLSENRQEMPNLCSKTLIFRNKTIILASYLHYDINMFYGVTVNASAAGTTHIPHHCHLLHSMDFSHPKTSSLLLKYNVLLPPPRARS